MTNWNKYFLPFKSGGRDFSGVDCWGLIYLAYKTERDIILPTYGDVGAYELIKVVREITKAVKSSPLWRPVSELSLCPFDVCVMAFVGERQVGHVGLMTSKNKVLHTEAGSNAVYISIDHPSIRERVIGFWRYYHE